MRLRVSRDSFFLKYLLNGYSIEPVVPNWPAPKIDMANQFNIRAAERHFVNSVRRELKPFLPLHSCSWLLK